MSRYRWIDARKAEHFPVAPACATAGVSPSAYYDWVERSGAPSDAAWDEAILVNEMHEIHHGHDDTYGSPRMTDELARRGLCVNHKRVERLMARLRPLRPRRPAQEVPHHHPRRQRTAAARPGQAGLLGRRSR